MTSAHEREYALALEAEYRRLAAVRHAAMLAYIKSVLEEVADG